MERGSARIAAVGIVALMVVGSLMLWVGIPIFWLWVGSKLQEGSQPSMGPYAVVLAGVIFSMIVMGKALSRLNQAYARATHSDANVRVRMPWHRSLRGERDSGRPRTVLDVVMVGTVSLALLTMGVWFLFFAKFQLPG